MIPKIIHYCWFGKAPLPKLTKQCIRSWKKHCPDFEIKEWNETNSPLHLFPFAQQALEEKKWAFVADVIRLYGRNPPLRLVHRRRHLFGYRCGVAKTINPVFTSSDIYRV